MLDSFESMGAAVERLEIKPSFPGQEVVIITDWDDCGVGRERFTRDFGRFFRLLKPHSLSSKTLDDYPEVDYTPSDRPVRGLEAISAFFHFRRSPIGGVAEALKEANAKKYPVIVASRRRAKEKWIDGTRTQADKAGVELANIFHTPEGSSGKVTKARTIKKLRDTHYLEDDPDTIKYVNREVPGLQIIHIDHGHHLSKEYLAENPNITVVPAKQLYRKKHTEGISATRNSIIREKVFPTIQAVTKTAHQELPWLTPTHLNFLGAFEVGLGAAIAASRDPKRHSVGELFKTIISSALIIKGSLMDAFDGALARLMAKEDPKSVDFKKGGIFDVISDRVQEFVLALSRAWSATKRGSKIGAMTALAAAITNPWPSIARAFSELRGKPVPESGKGIIGLIGTRPGKAVLGGLATEFPKPKGLPFQVIADLAITGSNVVTTASRLRTALGPSKPTLSSEVRNEAKTRLKVLLGIGGIALGASLFTYWRLNKKWLQEKPKTKKEIDLMGVLDRTEQYSTNIWHLKHRYVGGTITDFIGPQTEFVIDIPNKTVTLKNPNKASLRRSDGTIKDVDAIVFTPDQSEFIKVKKEIAQWSVKAKEQGYAFPQISMEAARHPHWPRRNRLKQFVTAWEIDRKNIPHLVFGSIDKAINPASIEPWKMDLGNGIQITTLNPVAHALCYELRVPSGVKRKDREEIGTYDNWVVRLPFSKISLVRKLARQTIAEGLRYGINYNEVYKEWVDYIEDISKKPDLMTNIKGKITGLYWDTIGTQVSHGRGILGRFSSANDKFAG